MTVIYVIAITGKTLRIWGLVKISHIPHRQTPSLAAAFLYPSKQPEVCRSTMPVPPHLERARFHRGVERRPPITATLVVDLYPPPPTSHAWFRSTVLIVMFHIFKFHLKFYLLQPMKILFFLHFTHHLCFVTHQNLFNHVEILNPEHRSQIEMSSGMLLFFP